MTEQIKKEALYEAKIKPLINQVLDICKDHEIPLLSVFHLGGDEVIVTTNLGEETDPPIVMTLLGGIVTGGFDGVAELETQTDKEVKA